MHWPYTITMDLALPPTYDSKDVLHKGLYDTTTECSIQTAVCGCNDGCTVCKTCKAFIRSTDIYFMELAKKEVKYSVEKLRTLYIDIMDKKMHMDNVLCDGLL